MTTMTRFVPFRSPLADAAGLQSRLNAIFTEFAEPESDKKQTASMGSFVPAVDVYEDAQQLVLMLEVPGIQQADLDIRLENQTLLVKGERRFERSEKEENYHRIERRFGTFARSFTLPQTVDTESVTAGYDAGVLTITLAKKAEAKPRQIKVEIGGGASGSGSVEQGKQAEGNAAA
jgi:HSP20 family protein